jgi:mannose-1-phosphate guanylyltransferase
LSNEPAIYAVILAGGQGTRFWPMSRERRPKQFLSISASGESLFQATVRRVEALTNRSKVMVVTNHLHEALIREHAPGLWVLSEPSARNTAASIGLAALALRARDPQAVMVVLPADHAVTDAAALTSIFKEAASLASQESVLVTIGVAPTSAHTGYGYIRRGSAISGRAYKVQRFFEKPNLERAVKYLESGDFYWNSGMFVWRVDTILEAITTYMPELNHALQRIQPALGTAAEAQVVREAFEPLEAVSIDFGIMEHVKNAVVLVGGNFGWNDVGSWDAWAEHFKSDAQGNLLQGDGILIDCKNCVVQAAPGKNSRMIALVGAQDLVVIDAGDALLVCPRSHVQDVRKVVAELRARGRSELM